MGLRNWLEETVADVNPWDNGKTGATIRAARTQQQKKPAPARTPSPNQRLNVRQANTQQQLEVAEPQSRVTRVEIPKVGVTSAPAAPLQVKMADPASLQLNQPIAKPQLPQTKPNAGIPLVAPKPALPDEEFTDVRADTSQRKKFFGIEGGKITTVKADVTAKTNKDKYVAGYDRLHPDVQKILVNSATEKAKKGDKAAQNTLRALTESGRMKGNPMDFVEASNERFLGGLDRAALRTADFVLPGDNTGGMGTLSDQIDATKTGTRQFSGAGKAGEVLGESQKIATDVASMVVPAAGVEKAIRATKLVQGMAGGSKLARVGAYALSNVGGGAPATAIQYGQQIGAGEDPNLAQAIATGAAADIIAPAAFKVAGKGISKIASFARGGTRPAVTAADEVAPMLTTRGEPVASGRAPEQMLDDTPVTPARAAEVRQEEAAAAKFDGDAQVEDYLRRNTPEAPDPELDRIAARAPQEGDDSFLRRPADAEETPPWLREYAESVKDPDDIVKELNAEWYAHGKETKGGQMIDTTGAKDAYSSGMKRISEHNQFYSDHYKEFKKAPTKADYDKEIRRQLDNGGGSMVDPDQATAYQMVKQRRADEDAVWSAREEDPGSFDSFLAENGLVAGKAPQAPTGASKASRFANKTVQESDEISPDLKKLVKDEEASYKTVTNEGRAEEARKTLEGMEPAKAYGKVIDDLENGAETGGQKEFNAIELAKRLDEAGDKESLAMSTEILHKLSENASKRGQEIQALSYLTNRTPAGLEYGALRDLRKAIGKDKITPEMRSELKALKEEVAKHEPGTDAHNFAVFNMAKFVTDQIPTGVAAKVVNIWRAGLLSAPTTTAGNILGNSGEAAARKLVVDPVAEVADYLMSKVTGKRTFARNGGFAQGAKDGAGKLERFMKTGYDERNALSKYDSKEINYGDGAVGTKVGQYVNGVYRLMSVADQPFWYGARNESLAGLAKVAAKNKKLKGKAADDFMNEFLDNPPKEAMEQATKDAKYGTFQNPTLLGTVAAGIKTAAEKHGGDKARAVADFFIPFTQVPASIATRVIQRSAVGTGIQLVKALADARAGKPFDQRAMAKAIGEGTFGTAAYVAGYNLANSGLMTFGFPEDAKERELWEAEGKQLYSVKVGDRWYSLNYLQPVGTLLAVGGEAGKSVKEGANPTEIISRSIATAGQAVMNQSFLKGISGVLDAIDDPKRYAENYVENTASSVVPNFIRSFARASDDKQRDPSGVVEGIQGAIPGMRQGLPEKTDMFGSGLDAKDNFLNQYVNPLRPSKVKNDDVVAEMRRLQDAGEGVIPSVAKKNTFEGTELTREQISQINKKAGNAMQFEYGLLMTSPEYQTMTDKQKADSLRNVNDTVYGAIKKQYAGENGIAVKDDLSKSEKRYLAGEEVSFASRKKADGSTADKTDFAKDLSKDHRKVLGDYDIKTSEEREKWFNDEPDAEYKYKLAKANNDKLNGTLTKAEEVKLKASLAKDEVGSKYKKETRELYSLSKSNFWSLVSEDPNGQAMADEAVAYGDALEAAGLGDNKFRLANGSISIAPAAKGKGGGKGGKAAKLSGSNFKIDGYLSPAATGKSLRALLADAKIESSAKKPQKA